MKTIESCNVHDIVSILDENDVRSNCVVCPVRNKVRIHDTMSETYENAIKTCQGCLVSLSRRKLALMYVMTYIERSKYFTASNIKVFIRKVCPDADFVSSGISLVLNDLCTTNVIEIHSRKNNGTRYKVVRNSVPSDVVEFTKRRGFGHAQGIKTSSTA